MMPMQGESRLQVTQSTSSPRQGLLIPPALTLGGPLSRIRPSPFASSLYQKTPRLHTHLRYRTAPPGPSPPCRPRLPPPCPSVLCSLTRPSRPSQRLPHAVVSTVHCCTKSSPSSTSGPHPRSLC